MFVDLIHVKRKKYLFTFSTFESSERMEEKKIVGVSFFQYYLTLNEFL